MASIFFPFFFVQTTYVHSLCPYAATPRPTHQRHIQARFSNASAALRLLANSICGEYSINMRDTTNGWKMNTQFQSSVLFDIFLLVFLLDLLRLRPSPPLTHADRTLMLLDPDQKRPNKVALATLEKTFDQLCHKVYSLQCQLSILSTIVPADVQSYPRHN